MARFPQFLLLPLVSTELVLLLDEMEEAFVYVLKDSADLLYAFVAQA